MNALQVECLRCGQRHALARTSLRELTDSECPRCGYLGWAHARGDEPAGRRRGRPIAGPSLRATA